MIDDYERHSPELRLAADLIKLASSDQRRRIKCVADLQQAAFNFRAGTLRQLVQLVERIATGNHHLAAPTGETLDPPRL